MSLLLDASFLAAALGHFAVDFLNSQRPVLLAVLSVPLGLTNALIGLISLIYSFVSNISQPLFGWLADRVGGRGMAAAGVLWMASMFGLAVIAPGYLSLALLVLAGLGSGAFHPAGTVEAAEIGKVRFTGREITAASIFFLFGQAGWSLGPAIGGPIVDRWGPAGLLILVPFVVPVGLNASRRFSPNLPVSNGVEGAAAATAWEGSRWRLLPFLLLIALRSWSQTNMSTFLPKYYSDLGYTPTVYGIIAAVFMAGSAIGGVAGGWLADRYDKRAITVWTLLLGAIPLALYPALGQTGWAYAIAFLAGALTGAPHAIIIVAAQRMMPSQVGAASGLALGYTFVSGSVGTLLSGIQADHAGFNAVFLTTAGITLIAAVMGLWMRKD
jgi:FSR family fosmidomycin resistance protein-like MFS transporter